MEPTRDARFAAMAAELGYGFEGEMKIGGDYVAALRHGDQVFVSGQVPRVGNEIVVTGRLGEDLSLARGQLAAKVCAMRALALLRQQLGSLDPVARVLRVTVFVQCVAGFTELSEVGDGATHVLNFVLGESGRPTRTSVGVLQLPKNAAVELDLIAAVAE